MTRKTRQVLIFIVVALIALAALVYVGLFARAIRNADADISVKVSA